MNYTEEQRERIAGACMQGRLPTEDELSLVNDLESLGHTKLCAYRQVFGVSSCTCGATQKDEHE